MITSQALFARCPVIPVVVLDDVAGALPLGEALLAGGIDVVEITLRTPHAIDVISALTAIPELLVGAGSVLSPEQVDQVALAGADFVVSPGLSTDVVQRCADHQLPSLPGVATGSELMLARSLGLTHIKFFPAGMLGGPAGVRALAAPFTDMLFMPTGGVNPTNLVDYLAIPNVSGIGGSWMVEADLLRDKHWGEVTVRSHDALQRARAALATRPP